ncbi:MAG: cobalamin synthesis protein P47K [Deltaproteobacteria bacterium]|nr:MAG: cobalamin synthesis protein P47K [Deltaproteobacteria bacterium]
MVVPRKITVEKPVKLIFAGGFLGSGKTTALAALAKGLIQRGMRVGIITNDQTENLVDTVIVKQLLHELGVPVEEVVKGCFCCKFDELMDHIEKILAHNPDILMGEPVGSCTDFVAAVANPIKIGYRDAFRFAPFSIMVDPDRVRELVLGETATRFPEEVAYLFQKQMEEADIIALNKVDILTDQETARLLAALKEKFPDKDVRAVSAKEGGGMDAWLDELLSGRPGANTVLSQIDYDRYATAEAVLGWLNAAIRMTAKETFEASDFAHTLAVSLREAFRGRDGEIGHLKFVVSSGGRVMWTNVTKLASEPAISGEQLGKLSRGTLILNARVRLEPEELETIVRDTLDKVCREAGVRFEIEDLQCFSPAYPEPPYLMRESVQ